MTPAFSPRDGPLPEVVLRDGRRSRTVTINDLAAMLELPPERLQAVALVLLRCVEDEPACPVNIQLGDALGGRGNVRSGSVGPETSSEEYIYKSVRYVPAVDNPHLGSAADFALSLAVTLDDIGSLGGYEKLVREHPLPLLQEALRRVERIPSERIAKSRGAVFTGIVRKLAAARAVTSPMNSNPYA